MEKCEIIKIKSNRGVFHLMSGVFVRFCIENPESQFGGIGCTVRDMLLAGF
jgi:hypothetical protein